MLENHFTPTYMKKLALLFFTLSSVSAFGQQNKFDVGLVSGPSIAVLHGNDIINDFHKVALMGSGGAYFQYNFPKLFSIRADFQFERKGSRLSDKIYYTDQEGNIIDSDDWKSYSRFDYLTVPLLFRASFGKKIKYFVNVGVFTSFLLKQSDKNLETKFFPTTTYDNTENFKRFDFGVTAGVGCQLPIKERLVISFEVRNNLGLYDISALPVYNDGTIKTYSTNFLFGLGYRLGKR